MIKTITYHDDQRIVEWIAPDPATGEPRLYVEISTVPLAYVGEQRG